MADSAAAPVQGSRDAERVGAILHGCTRECHGIREILTCQCNA
jgi:hypothetical protein